MITSQAVIDLLNEQIRNELESHAIYLAMSAWFETTPFKGFAAKYHAAALEEHGHAMKFYGYLADRDARIKILPVPEPTFEYASVIAAAQAALTQERTVSSQIRKIYAKAQEEGDFETLSFLKWFLDEQVEEERTAQDSSDTWNSPMATQWPFSNSTAKPLRLPPPKVTDVDWVPGSRLAPNLQNRTPR